MLLEPRSTANTAHEPGAETDKKRTLFATAHHEHDSATRQRMETNAKPVAVVLVNYEGAQPAALAGLQDLLHTAERIAGQWGSPKASLHVRTWPGEPKSGRGQAVDAVVLPPCLDTLPPADTVKRVAEWSRGRHAEGALVCGICVGTVVLAETGLLAGRIATTHWALRDLFASRFPRVELDLERGLVDEGDVITAAGLTGWLDLGLRLVERFFDPRVRDHCARLFLGDSAPSSAHAAWSPAHADAEILKVQSWLSRTAATDLSIARLAQVAGLGQRTFTRRFLHATGLRPLEYVRQMRIARAKRMLASSNLSVQEIARRVGYEDPRAFRRAFRALVGVSPRDYRQGSGKVRPSTADRAAPASAVPGA